MIFSEKWAWLPGSVFAVLGPVFRKTDLEVFCSGPKSCAVGSVGFLADFEFPKAVLGIGRCPIGLVAPWRLKTLDSQPVESNMGPL